MDYFGTNAFNSNENLAPITAIAHHDASFGLPESSEPLHSYSCVLNPIHAGQTHPSQTHITVTITRRGDRYAVWVDEVDLDIRDNMLRMAAGHPTIFAAYGHAEWYYLAMIASLEAEPNCTPF